MANLVVLGSVGGREQRPRSSMDHQLGAHHAKRFNARSLETRAPGEPPTNVPPGVRSSPLA
jgi:hypothetical protein